MTATRVNESRFRWLGQGFPGLSSVPAAALVACLLQFLSCAPTTEVHVAPTADPSSYRAVFVELLPEGRTSDRHRVYNELIEVFAEMGYEILRAPASAGYLTCQWVTRQDGMRQVVEVKLIDSSNGKVIYSAEGATGEGGDRGDDYRAAAHLALEGFRRAQGADRPRIALERQPEGAAETVVSTGTGVILCPQGLIATNHHVVARPASEYGYETASAIRIALPDARGEVSASILRLDPSNDLAILEAWKPSLVVSSSLRFRTSEKLEQGTHITAIGYPLVSLLGTEPRITDGIVSSKFGLGGDPRFLQISAPIQPGNSGGPLFDDSGNLVGVVVSTMNAKALLNITGTIPQNVNFALKSDYLVNLLRSVPNRFESCLVGTNQPSSQIDREGAIRLYGERTVLVFAEFNP